MKSMKYYSLVHAIAVSLVAIAGAAIAQQNFSAIEIKATPLGSGLYMLIGSGGNIGVSVGEDGVFIIDDQFAPLSEKILAAIAKLSHKPVSFVLNTHWHGDHTGGNENFDKIGALIIAHENVRKRMSAKQFIKVFESEVPAAPATALPVVTFTDVITFYYNDHEIQITHQPAAHTDGDSVAHFVEANVLHMGDTFFNGFFPYIDQSSGGTLAGILSAVEAALEIADQNTQIIPGHGALANRADLENYHTMLKQVLMIMSPLVTSGKNRQAVLAAEPLAEMGKAWGNGFMKTEVFTRIVYDLLARG